MFVHDLIRLRAAVPLNVCDFSYVYEHDPNGDFYGQGSPRLRPFFLSISIYLGQKLYSRTVLLAQPLSSLE